jgi:hypothetical protein
MRTNTVVAGLPAITIIAKDLEIGRKLVANNPGIQAPGRSVFSPASSRAVLRAVIVDVIYRKEVFNSLTATRAHWATVSSKHDSLQSMISGL